MMNSLQTPILFLIFNRPELTKKVFDQIKKAQPTRLYVAADGPRETKKDEVIICKQVRKIATNVDWDCEVRTLFREENLGCKEAVSGAIDWFFEHETEGIILEDDCLADLSFFKYCNNLLDKYRDNKHVMVISGNYFHGNSMEINKSYFFSRYNHCWGWATWRNAWNKYDNNMYKWPELKNSNWLDKIGDGHKDFKRYWTRIFDKAYNEEVDSWAYRWTFSCWVEEGLTILPTKNIVKNIGFDIDSTHTKNVDDWRSKLPLEKLSFPLHHPEDIERNKIADRWSDLNVFNTKKPFLKRSYYKAKNIIGNLW